MVEEVRVGEIQRGCTFDMYHYVTRNPLTVRPL